MKNKTVSFHTLGCKLNQAETDSIKNQFINRDYQIVPFGNPADVTVINTCTVTNAADSKSRSIIRKAAKVSPNSRTIVVGCYAQIQPQGISQIEGVDLILGTQDKFRIFDYLDGKHGDVIVSDISETFYENSFISDTSRTRAILKVQEGCDYPCSYCIVPFVRGKSRSRPMNHALEEAQRLVDSGHPEIVLSGVNLGEYADSDGNKLLDLLMAMEKIQDLRRIRISSIEPNLLTDEIIHLVADSEKICRHFHIPLQHASDKILKAMKRRYHSKLYRERVEKITEIVGEFGFGADVIVGFPGETEEDFQMLCSFIEDLPFTYLHVFRFSRRKGTVADLLHNQIDEKEKKRRSAILHKLGEKKKRAFAERFIGQSLEILFESEEARGGISGHSEFYHKITVPKEKSGISSGEFRMVNVEWRMLSGEC